MRSSDPVPVYDGVVPTTTASLHQMSFDLVSGFRTENKFGFTDNLDAVATDIWCGSSIEGMAAGGSSLSK